ncbi:MAG: archaeal proteasome endopeptidase complex subunit beta [Candidatus Diapherotrites archaeon]|nr:archaeal proteasome endopeptidase complex subunit beta [Candidatus Diapherotrites archaeon]
MEHKKTGTTTLGIVTKDGIILAADKQASMGNLVADPNTDKIYQIWDHIGLTMAGMVGDAHVLTRFLKAKARTYALEQGEEVETETMATFLSTVLNSNRYYPYMIQFILGGYVSKPTLLSIDAMGGLSSDKKFTSTGSGSPVALGVLEDQWKENMSLKEGIELAVKAINSARKRDIYTGGNSIDVVTITKEKYEKVSEKTIEALLKKN